MIHLRQKRAFYQLSFALTNHLHALQDSEKLPFNLAEKYHQFHNGIGVPFPADYTRDAKQAVAAAGRIHETGCPEYPF